MTDERQFKIRLDSSIAMAVETSPDFATVTEHVPGFSICRVTSTAPFDRLDELKRGVWHSEPAIRALVLLLCSQWPEQSGVTAADLAGVALDELKMMLVEACE